MNIREQPAWDWGIAANAPSPFTSLKHGDHVAFSLELNDGNVDRLVKLAGLLNTQGTEAGDAAAVADRFGLPLLAVLEIAAQPLEVLRARDRYQPRSNSGQPALDCPRFPLGSAHVMAFGDDPYVQFLDEFDPHQVQPSEAEENVRSTAVYQRYVELARTGVEPPYTTVFRVASGALVTPCRRRTLAAREAGTTIKGWLGIENAETGLPLKYKDVRTALEDLQPDLCGTPEEIDSGLQHVNENVRMRWIYARGYTPSPEQIERGLTDGDETVRGAWACSNRYTPTEAQIDRGIKDWNEHVRFHFARRQDFVPTDAQFEAGLTDERISVRAAWAAREDVVSTNEQRSRGLADGGWRVRLAWAQRADFVATDAQMSAGLEDSDEDVREAFEEIAAAHNCHPGM